MAVDSNIFTKCCLKIRSFHLNPLEENDFKCYNEDESLNRGASNQVSFMHHGEASLIKAEWIFAERECVRLCILLGGIA